MSELIVSADDYGYAPRYDEGIVEAAAAGAVDAVSCFATRRALGPEALLETGVELGLHLDLGSGADGPRADRRDRKIAAVELQRQHRAFAELFGREPAFIDGHHHCHARAGLGVVVAAFALDRELTVRSIDPRHRRLLRCRGVRTPDLLVGRLSEDEPALPAELEPDRPGGPAEGAVVEWMVHPGRPDPAAGSAYDAGREEDLELLLRWVPPVGVTRTTHAGASIAEGG